MALCVDCGLSIPDSQKVCSMCYGDPEYGSDGYYRQHIEEAARQQQEMENAAEQQYLEDLERQRREEA